MKKKKRKRLPSYRYRQPSPEGCLMRKVNKTPKVAAESRMAGRDGSGSSARPAIYIRNIIL